MEKKKKIIIHVDIMGAIAVKRKSKNFDISIDYGINIALFLNKYLGLKKSDQKYLIVKINNKIQEKDYIFKDKDMLAVLLMIGGG